MTALCTVGRLVFAIPILPNIQPMTTLFIIIALNIGIIDSLIVSLLSMLITNLILGMGPWTVLQIVSFAVAIILTGLVKHFYHFGSLKSRIMMAIWSALMGLLYGLIISYLSVKLYGIPNFFVYYLNGLPYDILHAVGNFGFFLILEPVIVPIIRDRFNGIV